MPVIGIPGQPLWLDVFTEGAVGYRLPHGVYWPGAFGWCDVLTSEEFNPASEALYLWVERRAGMRSVAEAVEADVPLFVGIADTYDGPTKFLSRLAVRTAIAAAPLDAFLSLRPDLLTWFHKPSPPEEKFWAAHLKTRHEPLANMVPELELRFRRNGKQTKTYRYDFGVPSAGLLIEIDGKGHEEIVADRNDRVKTEVAENLGWRVMRFRSPTVMQGPEAAVKEVADRCYRIGRNPTEADRVASIPLKFRILPTCSYDGLPWKTDRKNLTMPKLLIGPLMRAVPEQEPENTVLENTVTTMTLPVGLGVERGAPIHKVLIGVIDRFPELDARRVEVDEFVRNGDLGERFSDSFTSDSHQVCITLRLERETDANTLRKVRELLGLTESVILPDSAPMDEPLWELVPDNFDSPAPTFGPNIVEPEPQSGGWPLVLRIGVEPGRTLRNVLGNIVEKFPDLVDDQDAVDVFIRRGELGDRYPTTYVSSNGMCAICFRLDPLTDTGAVYRVRYLTRVPPVLNKPERLPDRIQPTPLRPPREYIASLLRLPAGVREALMGMRRSVIEVAGPTEHGSTPSMGTN